MFRTDMNIRYYLAYGSNLHPFRLNQRVPSATLIGKVELTDTRIVFHKRGVVDGSGKCTILKDEVEKPVAHGALFAIDTMEEELLDKAEGNGKGYSKQFVNCSVGKTDYLSFTYVAESKAIDASLKPYHWYKQLVLAGARYHQFPESYISYLEKVESIKDPDNARRLSNEGILENIKRF